MKSTVCLMTSTKRRISLHDQQQMKPPHQVNAQQMKPQLLKPQQIINDVTVALRPALLTVALFDNGPT